jgi:MarR family transcriptional regulator, transcriptional regulator for hemolysin
MHIRTMIGAAKVRKLNISALFPVFFVAPKLHRRLHAPLKAPHQFWSDSSMRNSTLEDTGKAITLGALIHDVARLRRHAFDEHAKPMGVTRSQFWVLSHLGRHADDGMNQSEIAAALEVGKVALGGLVDRLEASGHIRREPSADDRRVNRIRLTPKGRRTLKSMHRMRPLLDESVLRDVPEHTRVQLTAGLRAMRSNLVAMQRGRSSPLKRS